MFVSIHPRFNYFHFFKDPGQIPYRFSTTNIFRKSIIVTNTNLKYDLDDYLDEGFSIYRSKFKYFGLGIIYYLLLNSRKISVLHTQRLEWSSLFYAYIYKLFNKNGFVYLKLDNCNHSSEKFYQWESKFNDKISHNYIFNPDKKYWNSKIKDYFFPKMIDSVDLFSVEDESSCKHYKKSYSFFKKKLVVSYNGTVADILYKDQIKTFDEKSGIIVSAGRLGTYQKATEHLVEAFCAICDKVDWELHLAGSTTIKFNLYMEELYKKNSSLKKKIILHGNLNRTELFNLLNKSKIFCLPSRYEGWANVYSEAMYFSNAIITTCNSSLRDIIIEKKCGHIISPGEIKELTNSLISIINDPILNKKYCKNSRVFCQQNLNWNLIVNELYNNLKKK
tara:strand:- start:19110 stop:20282 length:1173 start_codon:yes stop_codon:yes gene_type:complete